MRRANYLITEVRTAVFSIRSVSLDEKPGRQSSFSFIVQVEGIPDGVESRTITDLLSRYSNLEEPPALLS